MARPIGTLGVINTMTVGGVVFTDLTTIIMLVAGATTGYTTMRKQNGTSGYQVTAGKTLALWAGKFFNNGTTASGNISLLYGDNDVGYVGAAPTTPIFYGGGSVGQMSIVYSEAGGLMDREVPFMPGFSVPATKYACMHISGNQGAGQVWGYES